MSHERKIAGLTRIAAVRELQFRRSESEAVAAAARLAKDTRAAEEARQQLLDSVRDWEGCLSNTVLDPGITQSWLKAINTDLASQTVAERDLDHSQREHDDRRSDWANALARNSLATADVVRETKKRARELEAKRLDDQADRTAYRATAS